jgi:hypothetical protein
MKLTVVGRTRSHQIGGGDIYFISFYSCNARLLPELPKKIAPRAARPAGHPLYTTRRSAIYFIVRIKVTV